MKPISSEIVEKTWEYMSQIKPQEISKIVAQMGEQQPVILAYVMTVEQDEFNQAEREMVLFSAMVIWRIMSQGDKPLTSATEDDLEKAERNNQKMVEYFEGEPEPEFLETVGAMINGYSQPEIFKYALVTVVEEGEDREIDEGDEDSFVRDENKGLMVISLKTIIDCLDKGC